MVEGRHIVTLGRKCYSQRVMVVWAFAICIYLTRLYLLDRVGDCFCTQIVSVQRC